MQVQSCSPGPASDSHLVLAGEPSDAGCLPTSLTPGATALVGKARKLIFPFFPKDESSDLYSICIFVKFFSRLVSFGPQNELCFSLFSSPVFWRLCLAGWPWLSLAERSHLCVTLSKAILHPVMVISHYRVIIMHVFF